MNCANHSDTAAVAFCRTCGKPLCNQCTRDVRGVIYCEACLAARMEGTVPAAGFVPPAQTVYPPSGTAPGGRPTLNSGPNPALAGILGAIPFGIGAIYNGQYSKGLTHMFIFVMLIFGANHGGDLDWVFGIAIPFFILYQIIDAVRTAKAHQLGEPAPDPFGLTQMFSTGEKFEGTKVPAGAAILIGLGVLFLMHTAGVLEIGIGLFVSLILILLGIWLFAKNWGLISSASPMCHCEHCRTHKVMGPAILVTLGVIFLLQSVSRVTFWQTWPAILLVIGVVKLMQSNASSAGHIGPLPPGAPPSVPPAVPPNVAPPQTPPNPDQTASSGEVNHV
jgi:B-box zinc finger